MAEQLGVATLLIGVNTAGALTALEAFKAKAESILSSTNTNAFSGLAKSAEAAGKDAGDKLAKGIKSAVTGLKFDNIAEALDFSGALNGTIKDLDTYKKALIALRDTTKTTAPGFNELNAQIDATSAQIKALTSTTDSFNDLLNRTDTAKFADDMKQWASALRENDTALRDTSRAIRDTDRALLSYDKASRDAVSASEAQAAAARELRDAYLGVAGAAVQAAAKGVGGAINIGKGAVGAAGKLAQGAVKAGKAGYQVGSEFGIFDAPSNGPVKQAIQEVIDRFAYLGKQAETTRGIILRSIEGIGTAVGLDQLTQNINILRQGLADLSATSSVTNSAFQGLNDFGARIAETWNSAGWLTDNGNTLIGKILNVSSATESAAAGATSLTDAFIQLGTQGLSGALGALETLNNLVSSIPPEAAGLTVAITGVIALLKNPIEASLKNSLVDLGAVFQMVEEQALQTSNRLQNFYENLAKPPQLALPSTAQLQPERNGIQRLDPQTNSLINAVNETLSLRKAEKDAADEAQRLSDALDTNRNIGELLPNAIERGARWFQKQAEYAQRVAEYSKSASDNQLKPALTGEFSRIPIPTTGANNIFPAVPPPIRKDAAAVAKEEEQSAQHLRDLHRQASEEVRKRRIALQQAAKAAQEEANAVKAGAQKRAIAALEEQRTTARQQRAQKEKDNSAITRRLKEGVGSALIGGAFPALFGQGAAASAGGGIGGLAGGLLGGQFGFGLSLVGTQIGQFVDDAVKKTSQLVDAFKDPIASFDALKQASLISSKGVEINIESLLKAGREEEAAAMIRADISRQFGNTKEAKALQSAYDEVGRSASKLGITIANALAPALTTAAKALSDFLNSLSLFKALRAAADAKQAKEFIGNDPSRQAEYNNLFKKYGGQLDSQGKPVLRSYDTNFTGRQVNATTQASRELLKNNGQLTELEKIQARETKEIAEGTQRTVALRKIEKDLIEESSAGDQLQVLNLQKSKLLFERTRALKLTAENDEIAREKIRADYAEKILKVEKDITKERYNQNAANIASANRIANAADQAAIAQKSPDLSGAGISALQATASYKAAIRAQQEAQAALNAAPKDLGAINNLKEANAAVQNAAATARTQLVEAFKNARKEAEEAASALTDAYLNLRELQSGNEGLNKYLDGQQVAKRQEEAYQALLPLFKKAKSDARNILGDSGFDINFRGSTGDVNKAMIDFIRSVEQEKKAGRGVDNAQEALIKAQNSVAVASNALAELVPGVQTSTNEVAQKLDALTQKIWDITVNVNPLTGEYKLHNNYARP